MTDEHSVVLGALDDASRRLRRCRKRHPRPRLRATLWPARRRDDRFGWTTGWLLAYGCSPTGTVGIKRCLVGEHGAGDGEQAVGDAAQGAAMAVTALTQCGVAVTAEFVMLNGDAGPVINRAAQPHVTGLAHDDDAALTTAPRHRGDTGHGAQRVIISSAQRLGSFGEQRGEDDPPDIGQGSQDRHVALLGLLPRRFFSIVFGQPGAQAVELAVRFPDLPVHQLEAFGDRANVGTGGFGSAGGHGSARPGARSAAPPPR